MKTYVIFGFDHIHHIDGKTLDHNCVAVIESGSASEGREKAFELFGRKFSFECPETYWEESKMSYFPRGYVYL